VARRQFQQSPNTQWNYEEGRKAVASTDSGTAIYIIPLWACPMTAAFPDPAKVLDVYLREAIAEIKVAYAFVPNSYTYSALQACLAAEQAFAVLRETLEAEGGT
jgi:hypothetical protein